MLLNILCLSLCLSFLILIDDEEKCNFYIQVQFEIYLNINVNVGVFVMIKVKVKDSEPTFSPLPLLVWLFIQRWFSTKTNTKLLHGLALQRILLSNNIFNDMNCGPYMAPLLPPSRRPNKEPNNNCIKKGAASFFAWTILYSAILNQALE